MKSLIIVILLTAGGMVYAEPYPDTLWTKVYGGNRTDISRRVITTKDGGFIAVGYTNSFDSDNQKAMILKTDKLGNLLWFKRFGGGRGENANDVIQTKDGDFFVIGSTFKYGHGSYDMYLLRLNQSGDSLFTRTYGGKSLDFGQGLCAAHGGGYVLVGTTWTFSVGKGDIYVVHIKSNGDTLWTRSYGGIYDDNGLSIIASEGGGYIIAGSTLSLKPRTRAMYMLKIDNQGDTLWTAVYGRGHRANANVVRQTKDGGYLLAGNGFFASDNRRSVNCYLVRTNALGDTLWTRNYGENGIDNAKDVLETAAGGFFVVGYSAFKSYAPNHNADSTSGGDGNWCIEEDAGVDSCRMFLIEIDSEGNLLWKWSNHRQNNHMGGSIDRSHDSGFVVVGIMGCLSEKDSDVYMMKFRK